MKGIIFDLDGVLVHTDEYHFQAWKALADRLNIPFDREINDRLRGVSRMESLEIILQRHNGQPFSPADKEALAAEKNTIYRGLLAQLTPQSVEAQVPQTLAELHRRGYRLAVGSSSKNTQMILERTGLAAYMDAVSDGTNIVRSKPDPEVFLKAAAFLGLPAGECAVVEDASSGIDAAKAADMMAIGIGAAARCEKTDVPIERFCQLLTIFKEAD